MILKLNVISVIESLNVKISEQTFCPSRSPQCVIRLPLLIRLAGETWKICLWGSSWSHCQVPSRLMQIEVAADCRQKRLFTSCNDARVNPRYCLTLIWSSTRLLNGQTTKITLFGCNPSEIFSCSITVENSWKIKLLPKPVGITAKTFLPSSKQFTAIFCSSFSLKLQSELTESLRNTPWTKAAHAVLCIVQRCTGFCNLSFLTNRIAAFVSERGEFKT